LSVACVVLTKNEEARIEDCLKRLRSHVDYILMVDDSDDGTRERARPYIDKILIRPFSGSFATERNHAEDHVPIGYEWVLHADADEIFPEEFLKNLRSALSVADPKIDAYRFPRKNLPDNKNWPDFQIRLLRRGRAIWKRDLHEVPYHPAKDEPIDKAGLIITLEKYPIIHLERMGKRSWW